MAEAIAREKGHEAVSAGTDPPKDRGVAENALTVLEEVGIETLGLYPKSIDSLESEEFDKIISMGCGVSCPNLPIDKDWGLEDPLGQGIEIYRKTRDMISKFVSDLVPLSTDA